jgi:membrane-associated phospholipid phosphatase
MTDDPTRGSAVQVAPRPARRLPTRNHRDSVGEVMVGAALVLLAAIGGVYFSFRPASGAVDSWFVVPDTKGSWFTDVVSLRYPAVIVVGAVLAAVVCFRQDRSRALACFIGPPLALLACELVAKPLVGRTLGGSLSYPSGSAVGAAALATAAVLATPARWRTVTIVVASLYGLWMAVAVVALRWHYPTDAMAGLAFGVGVVLVVDGTAGLVARRMVRMWTPSRSPHVMTRGDGGPLTPR